MFVLSFVIWPLFVTSVWRRLFSCQTIVLATFSVFICQFSLLFSISLAYECHSSVPSYWYMNSQYWRSVRVLKISFPGEKKEARCSENKISSQVCRRGSRVLLFHLLLVACKMYSGSRPSSLVPMKLMNCQLLKDTIHLKPETSNYYKKNQSLRHINYAMAPLQDLFVYVI